MGKCEICYKQNGCTIHPNTCDEEFWVFTNDSIKKHDAEIRADEREKVINDIRDWLHRAFDEQNNTESAFVPSIVLNEMIFVLLDNYIESHK